MLHKSVLLDQVCELFSDRKIISFLDATLGFGGHAEALLKAHPELEEYVGVDRDVRALALARERLQPFGTRVRFVHANFSNFDQSVCQQFDGILLDLGVSSMQLDDPEKGFSFRKDGPLDMRMDSSQRLTAAEVVNNFSEKKIADILWEYGQERRSRKIANAIVVARQRAPIKTTFELCRACEGVAGKIRGSYHLHPMTLVFQALRIYVNDELGSIERGVTKAIDALAPGGRLAVISFHSLEDRIVKNIFRERAGPKKEILLLTKKPMIPTEQEVKENRRARSAKMRVVERK